MCQRAGRKENSHYRTGDRDTQLDGYRSNQPSPLQQQIAAFRIQVGTEKRKQKKSVKEQNRRPLYPAVHGINAHGVGCDSDHEAERK